MGVDTPGGTGFSLEGCTLTGRHGLLSSFGVFPSQSYLPMEWPVGPDGRKLMASAVSVTNKQSQGTFDTTLSSPLSTSTSTSSLTVRSST